MNPAPRLEKKLLHYTGKAIADFRMIEKGDRVLVCLSGGKDSYTLLHVLDLMRVRSHNLFSLQAFTLDQGQPGWDDTGLRAWLAERRIPFEIHHENTYRIVTDKIPEAQTYCSLCSRLRRGIIYSYAARNGFTKIALGHHRDDLIESFMMAAMYNGQVRSMPPKLLTDDRRHVLIRPLAYCQEKDIAAFAKAHEFPIIPCNLCGSQENLARKKVKNLIASLAEENPKIPSNLLRAIQNVKPSQLMDRKLWDFKNLDENRLSDSPIETPTDDAAVQPIIQFPMPVKVEPWEEPLHEHTKNLSR